MAAQPTPSQNENKHQLQPQGVFAPFYSGASVHFSVNVWRISPGHTGGRTHVRFFFSLFRPALYTHLQADTEKKTIRLTHDFLLIVIIGRLYDKLFVVNGVQLPDQPAHHALLPAPQHLDNVRIRHQV